MDDKLVTRFADGDTALAVGWNSLQTLLLDAAQGKLDRKRIDSVQKVLELASTAADIEEKLSRASLNRARAYDFVRERKGDDE